MIFINSSQTFISVISAIIYGGIFAFICNTSTVISYFISIVFSKKTKQYSSTENHGILSNVIPTGISIVLILLYGLGFVLLSYYTTDGELRLYMLVLTLSGQRLLDKILLKNSSNFFCNLLYKRREKIYKLLKSVKKSKNARNKSNKLKNIKAK